jgi:hypothetical protein
MDGWIKPVGDFNNNLNWNRLFTESLAVTSYGDRYTPIQPLVKQSPYNVLLIGTSNPDAAPSWTLGCWLSVQLLVNPSSTANITRLAEIERFAIPVNRYRLVWIPDFAQRPFTLKFNFPRWHKQLSLECWWFDDPITTDVQLTLARIEESLDSLQ